MGYKHAEALFLNREKNTIPLSVQSTNKTAANARMEAIGRGAFSSPTWRHVNAPQLGCAQKQLRVRTPSQTPSHYKSGKDRGNRFMAAITLFLYELEMLANCASRPALAPSAN